ncbi:MAG: hypothetical protein KAY67_00360 [Aeromonadaceae bacterium]|jgi:hypothetical protein|nr:hypothetical protein [Aeromonadaceae bacterium]MBP9569501.1 hypothetical protein [Aeromonadaceae bacterium]
MKLLLGVLLIVLSVPTLAAITIDSNGIRINTDDRKQVDEWKQKHRQDCSSLKIGDTTIRSDGCQSKKGKSKENRSVHGDNNPGKGHDKKE